MHCEDLISFILDLGLDSHMWLCCEGLRYPVHAISPIYFIESNSEWSRVLVTSSIESELFKGTCLDILHLTGEDFRSLCYGPAA